MLRTAATTLTRTEILALQWLTQGGTRLQSIVYGSSPLSSNFRFMDVVRRIIPDATESRLNEALDCAKRIEQEAKSKHIQIIEPSSSLFPAILKNIKSPPVLLYAKGDVSLLTSRQVAVVGTRNPSQESLKISRLIAEMLAHRETTVTSGLALGCDTAAHLGALNSRGKTISVLAHGLDRVYPTSNAQLARRIIEEGGCLLSEYGPGIAPQRGFFPARNRLQSGLSECVVVVECGEKSGTMHTANFCLAERRRLFCFSPSEEVSASADFSGNELLKKKSALLFKTVEELERQLFQGLKSEQVPAFRAFSQKQASQENASLDHVPTAASRNLFSK